MQSSCHHAGRLSRPPAPAARRRPLRTTPPPVCVRGKGLRGTHATNDGRNGEAASSTSPHAAGAAARALQHMWRYSSGPATHRRRLALIQVVDVLAGQHLPRLRLDLAARRRRRGSRCSATAPAAPQPPRDRCLPLSQGPLPAGIPAVRAPVTVQRTQPASGTPVQLCILLDHIQRLVPPLHGQPAP